MWLVRTAKISLGEEFAGRQVLVEQCEPGVWVVRTATVTPDNERWLDNPETRESLEKALKWAAEHPARSDNPEQLLANFDAWD